MNREDLFYAIEEEASYQKLIDVLCSVVKLHNPCCSNLNCLHTGFCVFCSQIKLTKYPCPTIQAIEKELG